MKLRSIAVAAMLAAALTASAAPMYRMTIVEAPPGFADPYVSITAINNMGDVATTVRRVVGDPSTNRPMLRTADGATQLLPLPPGESRFTDFRGLNDRLQAVYSASQIPPAAYFWDPAVGWTEIVSPPDTTQLAPYGMNQLGDVVGSVATPGAGNAFSWSQTGGFRVRKPAENGYFTAINSKRQATGYLALQPDDHRPPQAGGVTAMRVQLGNDPLLVGDLILDSRKEVPLADRFNYRVSSIGYDINEAGTLAVDATGPNGSTEYRRDILTHACLWHRYRGLSCPSLPSYAHAIAVSGSDQLLLQISEPFADIRGTSIWREGDAAPVFIADLLEPDSPEVTGIYASDINELGAMAVTVEFPDGSLRGAILTPVEAPAK